MADEAVDKTERPSFWRRRLTPDYRLVWKRWSTWIVGVMTALQGIWVLVPSEARELLPRPELIGLGCGALALIAAMIRQGKYKDAEDE